MISGTASGWPRRRRHRPVGELRHGLRAGRRMPSPGSIDSGPAAISSASATAGRSAPPGHALGLSPEKALAFAIDNCALTQLDHFAEEEKGAESWRVALVNSHPGRTGP